MAKKFLIVVGDPTTAGGEAIEGDSGWLIEGIDGAKRPLVRVGNAVMCGQCGPTKVVQGAAFFLSAGAMAAYDGCLLACGHQMIAKMQRICSVDVGDASPSRAAGSVSTFASSPTSAPANQPTSAAFDEGFAFIDSALGKPLTGLECLLLPESSSTIAGTLSDTGCTPRCADEHPDRIIAAIEALSPLLL